jgi:erythromycin esterase-like protein
MQSTQTDTAAQAVRDEAIPLTGAGGDYDPLIDLIGDARFVLIGEASHGTHEFYRERARITRRLIDERGFAAVAVEADWPDAYRVNRFVRGVTGDSAEGALDDFRRFPHWMWRNQDVLEFIAWLRERNDGLAAGGRSRDTAGFYGLDLYSLFTSIEAVLGYLDRVDPEAARRARARYGCFEEFRQDSQAYGFAAATGAAEPCEDKAVEQLVEMQRSARRYTGGGQADDERFFAEQNARLVQNAEEYYRSMFRGRTSSWNLRDQHMAETFDALCTHLSRRQAGAKIVVWAHNSHLGDARATEMSSRGELNLGQLVRERHGRDAVLIGFSTYRGTVTAASDWDQPAERKRVRPGLAGSYERIFHDAGVPAFMLNLRQRRAANRELSEPRLQRAIGVIYRPDTERWSHYFESVLPHQFDVMLHFDETEALVPMERSATWETGEPEETYPTGL